jgi:uncharacterized membrane protein YkoI
MGGLSLCALFGLAMPALIARAEEKAEKITPDKLPQKVKDAMQARFPGLEYTSVEKETMDGKVVYDIELKWKGRKYEADIQEDGTLIEVEKEVDLKDTPKAVLAIVEEKYPKSKILDVMEVNKVTGKEEKPIHYEITLTTADGKKVEVIVSLDGKTIKEEGK